MRLRSRVPDPTWKKGKCTNMAVGTCCSACLYRNTSYARQTIFTACVRTTAVCYRGIKIFHTPNIDGLLRLTLQNWRMFFTGSLHHYIHTYIHTYILTCIHTYIHTYIRTYIGTAFYCMSDNGWARFNLPQ